MSSISAEHEKFLRDNTRTFIIAIRADGFPTCWPMVGRWLDGGLEFSTYRKSAKVGAMERAPDVCCLVTGADGGTEKRVLAVHGRVVVLTDRVQFGPSDSAQGLQQQMNVPDEIAGRAQARLESGKRCIVRVEPQRVEWTDPLDGGTSQ